MTPGFHYISAADYHADKLVEAPALSSSVAQILLRQSARKAWYAHPKLNPDYREEHDDKFDLGTAAHAALLEGGLGKLVRVDADDWRTNKAKEARDAARAAGKTALLSRHISAVERMVTAAQEFLKDCEVASSWAAGASEVTGLAEDDGVFLKARFDRLFQGRGAIFDYKTTVDAAPETFSRQIVRMGYHWQDAFYRRVYSLLSEQRPEFVFLAQSIEPPHECSLHGCDPMMQEIADGDVKHAIALWRECLTRNKWPSYGGRIYWTIPTNWQLAQHEQRIQEGA